VQRMQMVSVSVHDIFPKSIDCHGNVSQQIGKQGTGLSSALKGWKNCKNRSSISWDIWL